MDNYKKCGRCQQEKPFEDFNKCKGGTYGFHNHCRSCQKEVKANWLNKNKEWIKEYEQKPEVKERSRFLRLEKYKTDENFRKEHLEKNKIRRRGESAKIKQRANEKLRREINPSYRIRANLNSRIKNIFKGIGITKEKSIIDLIGCTMLEFIKYIESKWKPGMNWENYGHGKGKWQTDHKIPCCAFDLTDPEQQKTCYHYTNLQPLWWEENLKKGAKLENGVDARIFYQTRKYRKVDNVWSNYQI